MQATENVGTKGKYHVLSFDRDLLPHEIELARRYVRGDKSVSLPITHEYEATNLSPTVGRNVLARRATGDTTYSGTINYGAFGSGTTAFTNSSTQLNTEVYRKVSTGSQVDNNIAYLDWYIASGDVPNQTFQEFGAFIDGTGSANTGRLFSALITGGWVKSGAMFVTLSVTFS